MSQSPRMLRSHKLSEREAYELADMWVPQLGEHALFLHLLLANKELRDKAGDIYMRWRQFYCDEKMRNFQKLYRLLAELKEFKVHVLRRLNSGEWLGSAFPSFVDHILRELIYFEEKLNGRVFTEQEEVEFWNGINADHAGFASHLLDPTEVALTDKADETSKKIRSLPVANVVLALEAGKELSDFNKQTLHAAMSNKVKSVINPDLLKHVIREGEHGQAVLGKFVDAPKKPLPLPHICH